MSRPPAQPRQRTPRAPLLAPAPEAAAATAATASTTGTSPERAKVNDLTQRPHHPAPAHHEAPLPVSTAPGAAAAEEKFLSVRVPKDLHRRIRVASLNTDLPIRQIVLSAVIAWLDEHDKC